MRVRGEGEGDGGDGLRPLVSDEGAIGHRDHPELADGQLELELARRVAHLVRVRATVRLGLGSGSGLGEPSVWLTWLGLSLGLRLGLGLGLGVGVGFALRGFALRAAHLERSGLKSEQRAQRAARAVSEEQELRATEHCKGAEGPAECVALPRELDGEPALLHGRRRHRAVVAAQARLVGLGLGLG